MPNAARNLITAVQNSLLGQLFVSLLGTLGPWSLIAGTFFLDDSVSPPEWVAPLSLAGISVALFLTFAAWFIGYLANQPSKVETALHRVQKQCANGFEAWILDPDQKLYPPRWIRAVVTVVGRPLNRFPHSIARIKGALILVAVLAMLFAFSGDNAWIRGLYPTLDIVQARVLACWAYVVIMAGVVTHSWALDSVRRLGPQEYPPLVAQPGS